MSKMHKIDIWLSRWSPWRLRRTVDNLRKMFEGEQKRSESFYQEVIQRNKLIETLEGELECKTKECTLLEELAKYNLETIKLLNWQINLRHSELNEVAKEKNSPLRE